MTPAGHALLNALSRKAGIFPDADASSADWRSCELAGERHYLTLRFGGADAADRVERLLDGLSDHAFDIPGLLVADIAADGCCVEPGYVVAQVEALTFSAD